MPSLFDSASYSAVPVGAIIPVPSTGVPTGYLLCDGSSLSKSIYASLFTAIGSTHGDTGVNFNIPDYRGRFLRGLDNGTARDPDRSSRTTMNAGGLSGDNIGTLQADSFQNHYHPIGMDVGTFNQGSTGAGSSSTMLARGNGTANGTVQPNLSTPATVGVYGAPRLSSETRPINASVNYMIRYK